MTSPQPTNPASQPANSAPQPANPAPQPANSASQPANPASKPANAAAARPAHPSAERRPGHPPQKKKGTAKAWLMIFTFLGGSTWLAMFVAGMVSFGGVPFSVISRVLRTPATRNALFTFRAGTLHDLMDNMGIEEEIKLYHSKHIDDPVELDQHIHQILYNWTRYVGDNYVVGPRGKLMPKSYDIVDEIYECPGC